MLKTKIFKVSEKNLKSINKFLSDSTIGSIIRQEFAVDDKEGLFLISTINYNDK